MDVLHFIKNDHEEVRNAFELLNNSKKVSERRDVFDRLEQSLMTHLLLEEEYLYPEVAGLFENANVLVDIGRANHASLRRSCDELRRLIQKPGQEKVLLDKKISKLGEIMNRHFLQEEDQLMPRIRQMIATQEREDLGQVFVDAKDETIARGLWKVSSRVTVVAKTVAKKETVNAPAVPVLAKRIEVKAPAAKLVVKPGGAVKTNALPAARPIPARALNRVEKRPSKATKASPSATNKQPRVVNPAKIKAKVAVKRSVKALKGKAQGKKKKRA